MWPIKYKADCCDIAYKALCEGKSKVSVAADLDITRETFYQWYHIHKEFKAAVDRGMMKCQQIWEDNPPELSDARYIFHLKNRFGYADRSTDRSKTYSKEFTMDGVKAMIKTGEMTIDEGTKLMDIALKAEDMQNGDRPIHISIISPEDDD